MSLGENSFWACLSYTMKCRMPEATLNLKALLQLEKAKAKNKVDVWAINIRYRNELNEWRIDSFEYNLLPNATLPETGVVDSFVKFR